MPAPAPPKGFRPGLVIGGAAVLLGVLAVFGAFRGSAPQIVSVQFPTQIFANDQQAQGLLFFRTKKSDVAAARFDVISATTFTPFSFPIRAAGSNRWLRK